MGADAVLRVFISRFVHRVACDPTAYSTRREGSSARVPLGYWTLASRNERPGMDERPGMEEPVILFGEWPLTLRMKRVGERIRQLTDSGRVRHDLLVDKSRVGRIIGQRGSTLQALLQVRLC